MLEALLGILVGLVIGFITTLLWTSYVDIVSFCLGGIFGVVIAIVAFMLYVILPFPLGDERGSV